MKIFKECYHFVFNEGSLLLSCFKPKEKVESASQIQEDERLILFHTSLLYKLSPRFRSRFAFSLGLPFPYLERAGICRRMRTIGKAKKLLLVLRMHCGYKNKKQEKSNHKFHDILELIFPPSRWCKWYCIKHISSSIRSTI